MPVGSATPRSSLVFVSSLGLSVAVHLLLAVPAAVVLLVPDSVIAKWLRRSDTPSELARQSQVSDKAAVALVPPAPVESPPPQPPPTPSLPKALPPPESEPEEIRLGIEKSSINSIVWVGFEEATEHASVPSEIDQSGMTSKLAGLPVAASTDASASAPAPLAGAVPEVSQPTQLDVPSPSIPNTEAVDTAEKDTPEPVAAATAPAVAEGPSPAMAPTTVPEPQPSKSHDPSSANIGTPRAAPSEDSPAPPAKTAERSHEQGATEPPPLPVPVTGAGEPVVPKEEQPVEKVHDAAQAEKQQPQKSQQVPSLEADPTLTPVLPIRPDTLSEDERSAQEQAERIEPIAAPEKGPPTERSIPQSELPIPLLPDDITPDESLPSPTLTRANSPTPSTVPPASDAASTTPVKPAPPTTINPAQPPQPPPPSAGSAAVLSGDPAIENDKDADASSVVKAAEYRNGKVQAGEGLDVKTVRPEFSKYTRVTAAPRNPIVEIWLDRSGKVVNVELIQSSGYKDVDQPVMNAVWGWTAKGKALDELPMRKPRAVVKLQITMLLRS